MLRPLLALLALLLSLGTAAPVSAQSAPGCQYMLGFATLHALGPADVGDCLDDQAFAAYGDAQQHTTHGLLAWRKVDNWTAFTNGHWTWSNGPNGLAKRRNMQRFRWEANPEGLPLVDEGTVTTAAPPTTHVGPASLYPDPSRTPGEAFPDATAAQVYARYGIPDIAGQDEVDHFISLELGGDNALTNLWPEPYLPAPGAHQKDRVENYLHAQVCTGAMTLQQAQQAIAGDWYAVYQQMTGTG